MQKVFSWDFSEHKEDDCDRRIMRESTMATGTDDTFGRSSANERRHRDSKGNHASKYEIEDDDGEEDDDGGEEEDQGSGKLVEYPGGKIDSPKAEMRIESVEGDSFDDDDDDDDDRRSSACSEAITGDGDFSGLPPDLHLLLPTKYSTLDRNFKLHSKADSLVEALEKRRRQTVGNRLKELRTTTTAKTRPLATATDPTIREMPIIARRSPSKDFAVLPKQTTTQRRSRNYESVIVAPFFSKSKPSALHHHHHHRLPDGSPEGNGRRHFAKGQRETGDLRGMEHRSNRPRCGLPMGEGDQWYSDRPSTGNAVLLGASAAAAAAAAQSLNSQLSSSMEIAGNKSDDATPRQRDGRQGRVANGNERRQFLGEKPEEAESVRKTDRSKERENETERASPVTALPRLSSSSNGDLSFGGMASTFPPSTDDLEMSHPTRHSSDIRTSGPASRDTDNNLLRSGFNTTETPACIAKTRDSLTDTVLMDNTALHSNTSTLNEDGAKYKASVGRGDSTLKTNSAACTVETRKYYSDIHIKLKEAEPVFPSSFRSREVTQIPNGGVPGVSRSSSSSKEREADEESEISENVTPNWSSYPGPLLSASTAHESEDEEEAIGIIGRNSSDVNCADTDADTEANYNKLSNADCFVREISTPSTKVDDCQTNQTKTKDSDPERCSYAINLNAAAAERSVGSDKHLQPSAVFVNNNNYRTTNTKKISDHKSASDGSPRCRSTERREAYLVESLSVNRRILTRDSKSTRSASSNPTGRRSDDDGSCSKERSSTAQDNYEPASTSRRSRQEVSSIGAVNSRGLFSAQENAGTATDRLKNQQSSDATVRLIKDGVSDSANLRWESSATGIDDQKTGERFKSSSRRRRSPGKTTSIERIWQSIEEPRPRPRLRRKIRFEPEPGSPSSRPTDRSSSSSSSRRCRAVSCDGGGGAVDAVDAAPMENGVHRQNTTLSDEKDEFSLLEIEVPKVGLGLGFCIDGGKDGPYGDRPITVKRLFRGSSDPTPSAVNAKLCPGDEILSANGRNMTLLSRYVAWNYLKTLPEGTIRLVVRRQH